MNLEIRDASGLLAWSSVWATQILEQHLLVAVPRLRLSQEITQSLVARIPYASVFAPAVFVLDGLEPRTFFVVHATFSLYRTGEPDITDFALIAPVPGLPRPSPSQVINQTANMLRGFHGQADL